MNKHYRDYDETLKEFFKDKQEVLEYLKAAAEDGDHEFDFALANACKARGIELREEEK